MLSPLYAGDYDSPDKGKELAIALYSSGADVVFAVAGKTGLGVFDAAKELNGFAIGVDSDQKYIDPEHILCSMVKNIGESIYQVVGMYLEDGIFPGGTIWEADLSTGIVTPWLRHGGHGAAGDRRGEGRGGSPRPANRDRRNRRGFHPVRNL